jgi:signal transduction histidine kinase
VCNHERRVSPPSGRQTNAIDDQLPTPLNGRRADDDQSSTRPSGPEMRLARLPTEPVPETPISRLAQQVQRRDACATAIAHDRERIAEGLYDSVIHRLFAAGLQLQATCQVVDAPTQARIETTIDLLDDTITELRKAIFSLH